MSSILGPTQQQAERTGRTEDWGLLDPPPLSLRHLWGDLRICWSREYASAPWWRKLAFSGLRLIQNWQYRRGYGPGRTGAILPPIHATDFSWMEQNLQALPAARRQDWLMTFLECVNNPALVPDSPLPQSIVLELSNTCNLDCLDCGIGACGVDASRFMALEDLDCWTRQSCGQARSIRINGLGESTLVPHLAECVAVLSRFDAGKEIITNLTAPLDTYVMLAEAGFLLLVSWDACTAATFETIRRGAHFADLRKRLGDLAGMATARSLPLPLLLFTLRPTNIMELPGTVRLAAGVGVQRLIVNVLKRADQADWTRRQLPAITASFAEAESVAQETGVDLFLPDHIGEERVRLDTSHRCSAAGCAFPATQAVIRWDGRVTPCNMMNPYTYGSLRSRSFEACWNGPEAKTFRRQVNTAGRHPYCNHCYYIDVTRSPAHEDPSLARL